MTISVTQFGGIYMREVAKVTAFVLLIIGTIGLIANEFVPDWGRGVTITFACLNVLGLIVLAFATWTMGKRKAD